jgi:flagellar biogenesis protein FliO
MHNFRASHPFDVEARIALQNKTIVEVPMTFGIDWANPTVVKLIEQGGTIAALTLICLFIWLLTRLIEAAKKD